MENSQIYCKAYASSIIEISFIQVRMNIKNTSIDFGETKIINRSLIYLGEPLRHYRTFILCLSLFIYHDFIFIIIKIEKKIVLHFCSFKTNYNIFLNPHRKFEPGCCHNINIAINDSDIFSLLIIDSFKLPKNLVNLKATSIGKLPFDIWIYLC